VRKEGNETFMNTGNINFFEKFFMKMKIFFKKDNSELGEVISLSDILKCVVESIVYTLFIILIFYFLPYTKKTFLELNLHPLAIMVAFMALRYGTYLGFINALIATLGYIYAYLDSGNDMVLFLLKFQHYKFFLMFLFIAMLLGRFQSNYKTREEELKREKNKSEELLEIEKRKNKEVIDVNISLKNQIIGSKGSVIAFQSMRKILYGLKSEEDVYKKILSCLGQLVDYENGSIFIKKDDNLLQIEKKGNGRLKENIKVKSNEAERFMDVFQKKVPMEFPIDLDGEKPIFVAPLFYGNNIRGFIEVSRLSYSTSKSYNFEIFKVISDEINYTLQRIYNRNHRPYNKNRNSRDIDKKKHSQNQGSHKQENKKTKER